VDISPVVAVGDTPVAAAMLADAGLVETNVRAN
jgi:hypothetical protein